MREFDIGSDSDVRSDGNGNLADRQPAGRPIMHGDEHHEAAFSNAYEERDGRAYGN